MAASLKRPYGASSADVTCTKRSRPDHDYMMISKEDLLAVVCKMMEQQHSKPQRPIEQQVDLPVGNLSQLDNEHASEGWNRSQRFRNQSWNADQSFVPSTYIPTPPRTSYDVHTPRVNDPFPLPMSNSNIPNDLNEAYNYQFGDFADFGLQDPALEELPSEPLSIAFMMTLDNDNLIRQDNHFPENPQNTSSRASDKNTSERQHRKPFAAKEREDTGTTRKLTACIRCRGQRIRCEIDPSNPYGTCQTCTGVANQKIYKLPCLRYKVGDAMLFREGNAPSLVWSQRWNNMKMVDMKEWESPEIKLIEVSHGLCPDPIKLEVKKFLPEPEDVLVRKWVDGQIRKTKPVEPYAIVNMTKATQEVSRYIHGNVYQCLETWLDHHDRVVRETYLIAYKQSRRGDEEESTLLCNVLCLWFAIRHTTASEYLCGVETLGMIPEKNDRSYPLFGRIPIAPVMSAQLELILTISVLRPMRKQILKELQTMINANKPKHWFAIYLSCFILLHSCSLATAYHYKYSRRNGVKTRYAMPRYIQELHQGANILLAHFHLCNKGCNPFSFKRSFPPQIGELSEDQEDFVFRTAEYFEAHKEKLRQAKEYGYFEEEMYFVSQMFEDDWQPGPSV